MNEHSCNLSLFTLTYYVFFSRLCCLKADNAVLAAIRSVFRLIKVFIHSLIQWLSFITVVTFLSTTHGILPLKEFCQRLFVVFNMSSVDYKLNYEPD